MRRQPDKAQNGNLDAYVLHWVPPHPLGESIEALEALVEQGKIRRWGVSNFDEVTWKTTPEPACKFPRRKSTVSTGLFRWENAAPAFPCDDRSGVGMRLATRQQPSFE
jgi:hypothetical protein